MKIAVLGGDGTGPEVTAEAVKVLKAVAKLEGFDCELTDYDFGGERYLRTGEILPAGAVDELRAFDAIYLGAIGHPDVAPGILERGLLLELRFNSTSTSICGRSSCTRASRRRWPARGRKTSTSWWSARTPRICTAGSAGF
jgi:hypothetical protein